LTHYDLDKALVKEICGKSLRMGLFSEVARFENNDSYQGAALAIAQSRLCQKRLQPLALRAAAAKADIRRGSCGTPEGVP
jgi:hypothetical protein